MKSVWENSVMIGLRDVQREVMGRLVVNHPGYFAALEGDFEEAAGDAALTVGRRYFLFELKGTVLDVRTEWARKVEGPDGTKQNSPNRLLKYCFRVRKLALFAVLRLMLEPSINDLRRKCYCKIVFSGCVKQYFSSLLRPCTTSSWSKLEISGTCNPKKRWRLISGSQCQCDATTLHTGNI